MKPTNRRQFLGTLPVLGATLSLAPQAMPVVPPRLYPISCNQYTWTTFYGREKKDWAANLEASFAEYAQTGLTAFEPGFTSVEEVRNIAPFLKKYNISMPSAYVNSVLHDSAQASQSIDTALAIAEEAYKLGVRIMVTNPNPLRWGPNAELKSDAQLVEQLKNLEKLGEALRKRGITLAYHTHDAELKGGAREMHHMLQNTSPQNVAFCLDSHWVYRGSENSQVALFDIVKMYGKRIVELHIRQSVGGVWSETFDGNADINYHRLVNDLKTLNVKPLIVLEQCLEKQSPNTMTAVEAHKRDLVTVRDVFKGLYADG